MGKTRFAKREMSAWIGLGAYTLVASAVAWAGYARFQKTRKGFADVL
jgi:lipopolysaccharide transport system permease protein